MKNERPTNASYVPKEIGIQFLTTLLLKKLNLKITCNQQTAWKKQHITLQYRLYKMKKAAIIILLTFFYALGFSDQSKENQDYTFRNISFNQSLDSTSKLHSDLFKDKRHLLIYGSSHIPFF